eukprot:Nk52_evm15s1671 gene=Nk52_evmTU15s1671
MTKQFSFVGVLCVVSFLSAVFHQEAVGYVTQRASGSCHESEKQCEGDNFMGKKCRDFGYYGGNLKCNNDCKLEFSLCVMNPPRCESGPNPKFGSYKLLVDFSGMSGDCDVHPSGITFNPHTKQLLMVGDKGNYATMDINGGDLRCNSFSGEWWENDNEAVAIADVERLKDRLFIAWENPKVDDSQRNGYAYIKEYRMSGDHWEKSEFLRYWKVQFSGGSVDNAGIEGLTFIPDANDKDNGGAFWIGDQTKGAAIKVRLPLLKDELQHYETFYPYREINPGYGEASGLHYDPNASVSGHDGGVLFVSSDNANKVKAYTAQGESLSWSEVFPWQSSPGQEGIASEDCFFYISSDMNSNAQKIHRYTFYTREGTCDDGKKNQKELCADVGGACDNTYEEVETSCGDGLDNDCDGFVDADDDDCKGGPSPPIEMILVVEDSNDDAEEVISTRKVGYTSSDLEMFWEADSFSCAKKEACIARRDVLTNNPEDVCGSLKWACDYGGVECSSNERSCDGSAILASNADRAFTLYHRLRLEPRSCDFAGTAEPIVSVDSNTDCAKGAQLVGVRFNHVKLEQGHEVSSAMMEFIVDEATQGNDDDLMVEIRGEHNGDARSFSTEDGNISKRTLTNTAVYWSPPKWNSEGSSVQSPDVSPIINEILALADWKSDNAFVFVFRFVGGNSKRVITSVDKNMPAKLLIKV